MPLPGLKSSIELESGPTGLQLIDRTTGQKLPISETESRLLAHWDGALTATALSARLFVEGMDVEPWQVEQFFGRLAHAQVLAVSAPVVPDFIPTAAGVEDLNDVVPTLRGDLIIAKLESSRGTLEVKDPLTERSFTLYDFEVSIARMLDGKRTVADVLAASNRLGIPVTLVTLKTFLQQLRAYQFIDLKAGGAGDTTWPKRQQWTVGVRELYQSALRLMRARKFDEARGYADALVEADPSNADGIALRHRIIAEAAGSFELSVPFDTMHTPQTVPAVTRFEPDPPPTKSTDPFASFGFEPGGAPPSDALPPIPEQVSPIKRNSGPVVEPEPVLAKRSKGPLFIGVLVLLAIAGVLLHPVEAIIQVPCELAAEELGVPRAPRAGPVGPPEVTSGTHVEKGAVLARLTLAADESPEALEARIKEFEKKLADNRPPATAKDLAKGQLAVKKATAAVALLTKQMKKAPKKQLPALQKKLDPKQKALDDATAALEAMQTGPSAADLKKELEQLTSKKVAAAIASERSAITAPVAGLFIGPEPAPTKLAENDGYGRIIGTALRAVTKDPLMTNADTGVFTAPGVHADVKLTHDEKGNSATVEGELKWIGAKGTLEVASGRTAWILSVLK